MLAPEERYALAEQNLVHHTSIVGPLSAPKAWPVPLHPLSRISHQFAKCPFAVGVSRTSSSHYSLLWRDKKRSSAELDARHAEVFLTLPIKDFFDGSERVA